jgi:O-antigen ligase
MSAPGRPTTFVGVLVLLLLAAGPLLAGAVHEPVFVPLLAVASLAGVVALWSARGAPRPKLPGLKLALGLIALALVQLVPLPPAVLRIVSPGTYAFHDQTLLVRPLTAWKPISVSPPDTLRGLAFLAAFGLLAVAVQLELADGRWRRRLLRTVVWTGLALTIAALLQAVSPEPKRLYGVWEPTWDWAVFGPYVNRNHFAGYLVMAGALALGGALDALSRLRSEWARRRRPFLLLGESEGQAVLRSAAIVMVIVAGLVASRSRGGVSAFAFGALAMSAVSGRRRTALVVGGLVATGVLWIGLGGVISAFEARGVQGSRLDLWRDMLPMARHFPVFGDGWNAFSTAYPWYQTVWRTDWIGEAHNDYLQALLDGGPVALALVLGLFGVALKGALARVRHSPVELGLFGALAGFAFHELVDFNGQIPANAATFVALAALAARPVEAVRARLDSRARHP